jgi:4-hydroxy-tetrahydrodipicolinate synthase
VVRAAARAAAGRVPVLAGVMLPATGPAIEAARQAADEGADALVVGSPYYFGVEPAAQERHVEAVLAATPLPALLYNIPQCTHHVLPAETVGRLAREPRVLGIKDSAGDFEAFQKLLAIKRERAHFRVLQGHEALAAASLLQGGDGMVPGMANLAPALFVSLQAAADRAAAAECARLQQQITALARIYQQGPWLSALKAACAMLGLGNGRPAPPLAPAAPAAREAIAVLLDEAGLGVAAGAARSR